MNIWLYVKLATGAALLVYVYHLGGNSARTQLETFKAEQASNTAKAVLAERASGAAELARVNTIVKGYEDAPIDPVVDTLGSRLFEHTCPASRPVPKASPHPAGALSAAPLPASDGRIEQATQVLIDACAEDARELSALQAAWPKQ